MRFSKYLKTRRLSQKLTQDRCALSLGAFDESFLSLDANTVSRWERGLSSPSVHRQKQVVRFFQEDPNQWLPFDNDASADAEPAVLIDKKLAEKKYNMLVGALPVLPGSVQFEKLTNADVDDHTLQFVSDFDYEVLQTQSPIEVSHIRSWIEQPSTQLWRARQYQNTLLHFLALHLNPNSVSDVLSMKRSESAIVTTDLVDASAPNCFHIVCGWSHSQAVLADFWMGVYQYLYKHRSSIKHVSTIVGNNDGVKLMELLGLQPAYFGHEDRSGVAMGRRHYQWVSFQGELSSVLSTPLARKCLSA